MPNQRYRKGYRFEIRVKKHLERLGYRVFRLAGSKPLDLIAMYMGEIYLVECKTGRITKRSRERLVEMVRNTGAKPVIAYRDEKNRIRFLDPVENREVSIPAARRLL